MMAKVRPCQSWLCVSYESNIEEDKGVYTERRVSGQGLHLQTLALLLPPSLPFSPFLPFLLPELLPDSEVSVFWAHCSFIYVSSAVWELGFLS